MSDGVLLISGLLPNSDYDIEYILNGVLVSDLIFSDVSGQIILSDLAIGSYQDIVVFSLSDGCFDSEVELIISAGSNLTTTIVSVNPNGCNVSDGIITIAGLTDAFIYTIVYDINGIQNSVILTANHFGEITLTALVVGTYDNIIITEINTGCVVNVNPVVLSFSNFTATIASTNPTGCYASDGTITLSELTNTLTYTVVYDANETHESVTLTVNSFGEITLNTLSTWSYVSIVITEDSTACAFNLAPIDLICFNDVSTCVKIKNFFIPNNDVWMIEGDLNCNFVLCIYDRYGKLLKILMPNSLYWDGTFNGFNMPTNDYWYTIEYRDDNGMLQQIKSHFTLKR